MIDWLILYCRAETDLLQPDAETTCCSPMALRTSPHVNAYLIMLKIPRKTTCNRIQMPMTSKIKKINKFIPRTGAYLFVKFGKGCCWVVSSRVYTIGTNNVRRQLNWPTDHALSASNKESLKHWVAYSLPGLRPASTSPACSFDGPFFIVAADSSYTMRFSVAPKHNNCMTTTAQRCCDCTSIHPPVTVVQCFKIHCSWTFTVFHRVLPPF